MHYKKQQQKMQAGIEHASLYGCEALLLTLNSNFIQYLQVIYQAALLTKATHVLNSAIFSLVNEILFEQKHFLSPRETCGKRLHRYKLTNCLSCTIMDA